MVHWTTIVHLLGSLKTLFQHNDYLGASVNLNDLMRFYTSISPTALGMSLRFAQFNGILHMLLFQVIQFNQHTLAKVTSGYVINLVAGDTQRFENAVVESVFLFQAMFEFSSVVFLTWFFLGLKGLSGILFMVCLIAWYAFSGYLCTKLRLNTALVTDKRISIMNAIIPGIRTVKMYAWELPFLEKVQTLRG